MGWWGWVELTLWYGHGVTVAIEGVSVPPMQSAEAARDIAETFITFAVKANHQNRFARPRHFPVVNEGKRFIVKFGSVTDCVLTQRTADVCKVFVAFHGCVGLD